MRPRKTNFRSDRADFWSKRVDFRLEKANMKSRIDFRPERPDKGVRNRGIDQSLKSSMWSATPVALLCTIVNQSERKQGSGPKGDKDL